MAQHCCQVAEMAVWSNSTLTSWLRTGRMWHVCQEPARVSIYIKITNFESFHFVVIVEPRGWHWWCQSYWASEIRLQEKVANQFQKLQSIGCILPCPRRSKFLLLVSFDLCVCARVCLASFSLVHLHRTVAWIFQVLMYSTFKKLQVESEHWRHNNNHSYGLEWNLLQKPETSDLWVIYGPTLQGRVQKRWQL